MSHHRLHKLHYALKHKSWILTEWVLILLGLMGYTLIGQTFGQRLVYLTPLLIYSLLILWLQPQPEEQKKNGSLIQITYLKAYLLGAVLTTINILAALYLLSRWIGPENLTKLSSHSLPAPGLFPYIVVSALTYEWVFRRFMMTRLETLSHHWVVDVLMTSILFTLTQTAYDSPYLILAAFLGSAVISRIYYQKPSWLLATLAHIIIFGTLLTIYTTWQGALP